MRESSGSARTFRDVREFKSWNDAMVEKYDVEQFHDHPSPLIRYIERKRVRRILALLAARPEHRVLEVGCGAGNIQAQIPGVRRCGIDLAESLLAKAARRLAKRGARGTGRRGPPAVPGSRMAARLLLRGARAHPLAWHGPRRDATGPGRRRGRRRVGAERAADQHAQGHAAGERTLPRSRR